MRIVRRPLVVTGIAAVLVGLAVLAAAVAPSRAGSAVPRCTMDQLALAAHVEGTAGALVPNIDIWHVSGPKCHLDRKVSLAVKKPSGAFLAIKGNPGAHRFDRDLPLHRGVTAGWGWSNWCKAQGKVTYRFTLGARTLILRTRGRPSCPQPGAPSKLRFLRAALLP